MMRIVGILAVIGILAASVFASAAILTVDGGIIQEGADTTLTCVVDKATVSNWVVDYTTNEVKSVDVSGLGGCAGTVTVQLWAGGTPLALRTELLLTPIERVTFDAPVASADTITGVQIWVSN
jgi:hypothetical protein